MNRLGPLGHRAAWSSLLIQNLQRGPLELPALEGSGNRTRPLRVLCTKRLASPTTCPSPGTILRLPTGIEPTSASNNPGHDGFPDVVLPLFFSNPHPLAIVQVGLGVPHEMPEVTSGILLVKTVVT